MPYSSLHDVGLEEFDANLHRVGLATTKGRRKPAFDALKKRHSASQP